MIVSSVEDVYALRRQNCLPMVRLILGRLKRRDLLRYALKYALWAVAPGGRIEIIDDGPDNYSVNLYDMPFSIVRQQCFKIFADMARLVAMDPVVLSLTFERTAPILAEGWSAGVIFSGAAAELPFLRACIAGLYAQPELSPERGGEILVCGPSSAADAVAGMGGVDFVALDDAEGTRSFTTRKKNALVAAARNPRVAILHTRIILQPGCLAAFPREFDVSACVVEYREGRHCVPYLDWIVVDRLDTGVPPRRLQSSNFYDRTRHLNQLGGGKAAYIDGGAFFAATRVVQAVPLNNNLAWGEAEDVEWCERLAAQGFLVDLEPRALAVSQSFKLSPWTVQRPRLLKVALPARRLARLALANAKAWLRQS